MGCMSRLVVKGDLDPGLDGSYGLAEARFGLMRLGRHWRVSKNRLQMPAMVGTGGESSQQTRRCQGTRSK